MIKIFRELIDILKVSIYHTKDIAKHDALIVFKKTLQDLNEAGFPEQIQGKNILDLGCGQRFPFSLLCAASGANAFAIDLEYVKPDPVFVKFFKVIKQNGTKRAFKYLIRSILFDKKYYSALESYSGIPVRKSKKEIKFFVTDPTLSQYPLISNTFDLIASNAVLEHVKDVENFAIECNRLLSNDGYLFIIVHNYYSLSGGHNLNWAFPDTDPPKNISAWDHLRKNQFPTHVYLNKKTPEEYYEIFSNHLNIILFQGVGKDNEPGQKEGKKYLTAKIREELKAYPEELLLTRSYLLICKKSIS